MRFATHTALCCLNPRVVLITNHDIALYTVKARIGAGVRVGRGLSGLTGVL